jgi:hypothetical protein
MIDEVGRITTGRHTVLSVVGRGGAELALFGTVLFGLAKASEYVDLSVWSWLGLMILLSAWFLLGAIPLPWARTRLSVGGASFLIPFVMLALIYWAFERMPIVPTWEQFPRVLLSPRNISVAVLACTAAVSGQALTAGVGRSRGRRTRG